MQETRFDSLLEQQESLLSPEQMNSLMQEQNTTAGTLLNQPQEFGSESPNPEIESEVARQQLIAEHNKRIIQSPEYQARVVFEQYVANAQSQGIYYTGPQRKSIYKQILRKAKKGRYSYLFDEEKQKRRAEKMRSKFNKLNKPQPIHSVDELAEPVKERLKEMVNEEPWNDLKPKTEN